MANKNEDLVPTVPVNSVDVDADAADALFGDLVKQSLVDAGAMTKEGAAVVPGEPRDTKTQKSSEPQFEEAFNTGYRYDKDLAGNYEGDAKEGEPEQKAAQTEQPAEVEAQEQPNPTLSPEERQKLDTYDQLAAFYQQYAPMAKKFQEDPAGFVRENVPELLEKDKPVAEVLAEEFGEDWKDQLDDDYKAEQIETRKAQLYQERANKSLAIKQSAADRQKQSMETIQKTNSELLRTMSLLKKEFPDENIDDDAREWYGVAVREGFAGVLSKGLDYYVRSKYNTNSVTARKLAEDQRRLQKLQGTPPTTSVAKAPESKSVSGNEPMELRIYKDKHDPYSMD